jgi:hypothetical protein
MLPTVISVDNDREHVYHWKSESTAIEHVYMTAKPIDNFRQWQGMFITEIV